MTVVHAPIKIGVVHGHQCIPTGDLDSLSALARQMDVDVLITGHTHTFVPHPFFLFVSHIFWCRFQAIQYDNLFFVNPGSATGAWSGSYNGCVLILAIDQFQILIISIPNLLLQRCYPLFCSHGHPGPCRSDVCLPASRRRSPR
jgi:Calcineurin-like phosphoesterase superfamily domain